MSYVFLASPYSDVSEEIMAYRYRALHVVLAAALRHEVPIFSPIAHWHLTSLEFISKGTKDRPVSFEDFRVQSYAMLEHALELWILQLDGWTGSQGIRSEIEFAELLHIPIIQVPVWGVEKECKRLQEVLDSQKSSSLAKPQEKVKSAPESLSSGNPEKNLNECSAKPE